MTPTSTDAMKNNLGEAGSHLKQAAVDTGDALKGAAAPPVTNCAWARPTSRPTWPTPRWPASPPPSRPAPPPASRSTLLMDKGRDLIESAAELVRERPLASFGVAFAAGWIIAKLARSGQVSRTR